MAFTHFNSQGHAHMVDVSAKDKTVRIARAKGKIFMRRDTLEKESVSFDNIVERVKTLLDDIQANLFEKARAYRDAHVYECDNYDEFKERVKDGGFFLCHWDGTAETEAKIKEDTQATIRCVPFDYEQTEGVDMVSGKPAKCRVIIARSY